MKASRCGQRSDAAILPARAAQQGDAMMQCFCGMVHDLGRRGFLGALMAAAVDAQAPTAASAGPADPALIDDLVAANRILYDQGVVDGFGHVSSRHDKNAN